VRSFANADHRVTHIRFEQNIGLPAITMLAGFKKSSGDIIAYMFDDCEWHQTFLEEMVDAMDKNPSNYIAYSQCELISNDGPIILGEQVDFDRLRSGHNMIANCATVMRRSLFDKIGWFDPRVVLVRSVDWDMLRRASFLSNFLFVQKVLAKEYGVSLPNSLGNTYSVDMRLSVAVAECIRADITLQKVEGVNVLSLPDGLTLTADLEESYFRQLLEFCFVGSRENLLQEITRLPAAISIFGENPLPNSVVRWWLSSTRKHLAGTVALKDDYIRKQHEYIERQHKMIDELQKAKKRSLTSRWKRSIQKRLTGFKSSA
jgi:hypothetical protein